MLQNAKVNQKTSDIEKKLQNDILSIAVTPEELEEARKVKEGINSVIQNQYFRNEMNQKYNYIKNNLSKLLDEKKVIDVDEAQLISKNYLTCNKEECLEFLKFLIIYNRTYGTKSDENFKFVKSTFEEFITYMTVGSFIFNFCESYSE